MTRVLTVSGLLLWVGTTLLLSTTRWFSRVPLAERLRPYAVGGMGAQGGRGLLSVESFREAVGPLSQAVGERIARALGIGENLDVRLARIHSPLDPTGFRIRQVGYAVAAFGVAAVFTAAVRPPLPIALLFLMGGPLLAFLLLEQQLASASKAWQRRVFLELPVVAEQLAMLLSAGFSLTSALNRISTRGQGATARDLRRVVARVRQGLSEVEALREWAAVAQVDALDRLVPVLALNREASDLGRLLSEEARAIRRDVQRELTELVERRGQQVWIPVTVATLLPGVIFLAVPFVTALQMFAS
ncbi:MAG TPA: type II secretion system F family protein [Egibacteraceae bacterium]|nr:type II secretion system F family protein [Egibacteraceae bacterium]